MPTQTGAIPVRAFNDGPRVTVDTFLNDPLKIPALVYSMMDQQFIADALLRNAGTVTGGAVQYFQSTPFYADSDSAIRAEFAEVPIAQTSVGTPSVAYVAERALAILISDEMKRRMSVDPVNTQLTQVKNTMVQNWDSAFISTLLAKVDAGQVVTGGNWATATSGNVARGDIVDAMQLVATAKAPGQNTAFGFKADTLVIGMGRQFDLIRQDDFNKPFQGNIADENLLYTGKLPSKIMGLDVVVSRTLSDNIALVMQRKVVGAIADELPMQASALYRDEPRKVWRCDIQRASAIVIDQPLAVAQINISTTP